MKVLFNQCSCGECCKTTPGYYCLDIDIREKVSPNKNMYISLQPKQNMEQSKEIQKNWTGLENFDICYSLLSDCYCQIFKLWKEDWALQSTQI